MVEYIERNALIAKFKRLTLGENSLVERLFADGVYAVIETFPAADVAEVVQGKWEPGNPICPVCGENKFKDLDADVWADWQPKFCPNCGARMGKEDEHEAG